MTDYSEFPFHLYTTGEIVRMLIESAQLNDEAFVKACQEELKHRTGQIYSEELDDYFQRL